MFSILTLEDLLERLKKENLPHTLNTILELEKQGVLFKPAGTRKLRLYSGGEVEYIIRAMREKYKNKKRYKLVAAEDKELSEDLERVKQLTDSPNT